MKVLFVSPYYKPYFGGIERVIEKLGREFLQMDEQSQVRVLTSKWSFPRRFHRDWAKEERIQNVGGRTLNGKGEAKQSPRSEQIFRLDSWPSIAPPFFQVPLVWFSPWEIRNIIDQFQPDVIQLMSDRWFWVNFWVVFWARFDARRARRRKIPVMFSLSFHQLTTTQSFLRPINALLTRMVDKVQVITEYEKQLVKETYRTPDEQMVVIPWGVEGIENGELRVENEESKTKTSVTILSVGRVSRHKGQLWLANVYAQAKFNQPTRLVLVGEIEDLIVEQQLRTLKLPPGKELNLTDQVSDVELEKWYQQADLFALFPAYEAFGLVFLEAMSHGVPVLTHRVGALAEVLKQGAVLIESYDQTQATTELSRLVNDVDLRDNLGKQAWWYVKENFSWKNTANSFMQLYQDMSVKND